MVNFSKVIILFFWLSISLFSCKDAKLVIPKENNTTQKLNLNGYFYLKKSSPFENSNNVYFLYENGIILYVGSLSSNDETTITNYINNEILKYNTIYKTKYYWGLYNISENNITIERWQPGSAGERLKTVKSKGEVVNKNSFKLTSSYSNYTKKNYQFEEIYEFRAFSPKPDSTNNFIK
jgi:hypothetical protein